MYKVLIIEDDDHLRQTIYDLLIYESYQVYKTDKGQEDWNYYQKISPDIILLDLGLPDINGFELLRKVRHCDTEVKIIIITASQSEGDQIRADELTADEYIKKPFSSELILSKIKKVTNYHKTQSGMSNKFQTGNLTIDYSSKTVIVNCKIIKLTYQEYSILEYLTKHSNRYIKPEEILDRAWIKNESGDINSLRVEIFRIRTLIEYNNDNHQFITCKYRLGYKFNKV